MYMGKISKRKIYTAKELLKMDKYRITGKLAREIAEIEKKYAEQHGNSKKRNQTIKVEDLIKEIKNIPEISIEKKKNEYFVRYNEKSLFRTSTRRYGVSIGMRKNGRYLTIKMGDRKELGEGIKEIKEMIKLRHQQEK